MGGLYHRGVVEFEVECEKCCLGSLVTETKRQELGLEDGKDYVGA